MPLLHCKNCGRDLPISKFYKDSRLKRGYRYVCKACQAEKKASNKNDSLSPKLEDPVKDISSNIPSEDKSSIVVDDMDVEIDEDWIIPSYPQFEIEKVLEKGKHYSMVMVASRNSGKTTLYSYYHEFFKKMFDIILIFCNSLQAEIYKFLTPDEKQFAFDTYVPAVLRDMEKVQKQTKNAFHILNVFDDCVNLTDNKNSDDILQLFSRGRNKNNSVLFSAQSPMFMNKNSRPNTDILFILNLRTASMMNAVIDQFLYNVIPTPKSANTKTLKYAYYHKLIKEKTKDHGVLVIDFLNDEKIYEFRVPEEFVNKSKKESKKRKRDPKEDEDKIPKRFKE